MSTFKKGDWVRSTQHTGPTSIGQITEAANWCSLDGVHRLVLDAALEPWVPRVGEWVMVRGPEGISIPHKIEAVHPERRYLDLHKGFGAGFYGGCGFEHAVPCCAPIVEPEAKPTFKKGDWVRHLNLHEYVGQVDTVGPSHCCVEWAIAARGRTGEPFALLKPWVPKAGEWVKRRPSAGPFIDAFPKGPCRVAAVREESDGPVVLVSTDTHVQFFVRGGIATGGFRARLHNWEPCLAPAETSAKGMTDEQIIDLIEGAVPEVKVARIHGQQNLCRIVDAQTGSPLSGTLAIQALTVPLVREMLPTPAAKPAPEPLPVGTWLAYTGSSMEARFREARFRIERYEPRPNWPERCAVTRIEGVGARALVHRGHLHHPRASRVVTEPDAIIERFEKAEREGKVHIYETRLAAVRATFAWPEQWTPRQGLWLTSGYIGDLKRARLMEQIDENLWHAMRLEPTASGFRAERIVIRPAPNYELLPLPDAVVALFETHERAMARTNRAGAKSVGFASIPGRYTSPIGTPLERLDLDYSAMQDPPPAAALPGFNTKCTRCGGPAYVGLGFDAIECPVCNEYGAIAKQLAAGDAAAALERRNLSRKHPETQRVIGVFVGGELAPGEKALVGSWSKNLSLNPLVAGPRSSLSWAASLAGIIAYGPTEEAAIAAWRKKARGAQ